jgi:hypothetical protein
VVGHAVTLGITELDAVVAELAGILPGARLTGVDAMPHAAVRLRFATPEGLRLVRVSARPRMARIHLDAPSPDHRREEDRAAREVRDFAARVARELRGSTLVSVQRVFQDRVVEMSFSRKPHDRSLIFECSGHHPNLFLADDRRVILASLVPSRSIRRDLRPGRPYRRPLPHEHEGPEAVRFLQGAVSEAIAAWYGAEEEREDRLQDVAGMREALKGRLARQDRLVQALEEDLARASAAAAKAAEDPPTERTLRLAREEGRLRSRLEAVRAFREEIRVLLQGLLGGSPEGVRAAGAFLAAGAKAPEVPARAAPGRPATRLAETGGRRRSPGRGRPPGSPSRPPGGVAKPLPAPPGRRRRIPSGGTPDS